ncbi:dipeptide ABC transporter ATP-binding protein [Salinibacterium hongtaonis]|uniref:dipeptide ABC transporter ATP-binding protein n=1 Tax=Homoserinimonas hongtaonis TaxID=2079791 RepID=UPI000D3B884C|nr:ABC transporter ATP-binding protein [Salinibacterium hongtaonis]AWB89485.1 ABC transporter ATP-binding protein [Salinibacterium hongtaonis]
MTDDLLVISDLLVDYRASSGTVHAVKGISFSVPRGGVVAVVGESGSGKSTVSQSIVNRLSEGGVIVGGSIRFDGRELIGMREREIRKLRGAQIGFVPQDPSNSLNPLIRVGEQIAEVLRLHQRLSRQDAAARAVEILAEVGIVEPEIRATQYPHELSGGMRQRVLIGIAWACNPALVIADEPTSALDVTVQKQVLDRIEALAELHGTAVVLVTHDLAVAADRADRIVVMQSGRVVEEGLASEVLGNPQHDYTRKLVAAAPGLSSARLTPTVSTESRPVPLFLRDRVTQESRNDTVLSLVDIVKTYSVRRPGVGATTLTAVNSVSIDVARGSTFSIVGESGSGKTTLARIAARIIPADSGSIMFDGQDISALRGESLRQLRRRIQVVYQNPFGSLDPSMSIERIITEPLRAFSIGDRASRRTLAHDLLDRVSLPVEIADRRPRQLSGGQRQRVAIARALSLGPELIVLDEPVSALDVSVQEQILQLLVDLQQEFGLSYLFISHDLGVIRQVSDGIAVMRHGDLLEHGAADDVLSRPAHDYTRELLSAIPGQLRS